ncbi:MAG: hypothetical protein LAP61_29545 [Acidobacteriia bacterium]|nr:hypothetical protein [Terriglobia bacterium]
MTDGAINWTFTRDLVSGYPGLGCFVFGTEFATMGAGPFGSCGFGVGGPAVPVGGFYFTVNGGLPMAPGVYLASYFIGLFDSPATSFEWIGDMNNPTHPTGDIVLIISPEPSSLSLMAGVIPLMLISWRSIRSWVRS